MAQYHLFYAGYANGREMIGSAISSDFANWTKNDNNPIISLSREDDFDSVQVSNPCVVSIGDMYHLIYQAKDRGNTLRFGRAISTDLKTWEKDRTPFFSMPDTQHRAAGAKRNGCQHPHVVVVDDGWLMYFVYQQNHKTEIRVAHTQNFSSWEVYPGPCIKQSRRWESHAVYYPWVIKEDGVWTMWYSAVASSGGRVVWNLARAVSHDGITWKREPECPLARPNAGYRFRGLRRAIQVLSGNRLPLFPLYYANPCVVKIGARYRMVYHAGMSGKHLSIGWMDSDDGINWTAPRENTIRDSRTGWDRVFDADPFVLIV